MDDELTKYGVRLITDVSMEVEPESDHITKQTLRVEIEVFAEDAEGAVDQLDRAVKSVREKSYRGS